MDYRLVLPVHCCKTVGLSPFIDGILKMQKAFCLSRHQCVAVAYNVLTSERPFFFWDVCMDYIRSASTNKSARISAVDLGLQFHDKMTQKIARQKIAVGAYKELTSRHQPHNNTPPSKESLVLSIVNLIRLTDAIMSVSEPHRHKEFYHSKSIAILTGQPNKGGCHGAGVLTSQSLLHVLSCLGLIPLDLAYWGEIAINPGFLSSNGIT